MPERRINKPTIIIGHHTAVSRAKAPRQFWAVNRYHEQNPNTNLGYPSTLGYYGAYQIFFEPDGAELRYREDWEEGAHTKGHNLDALAFCWAGDGDIEFPTDPQATAVVKRIKEWQAKYSIPNEKVYIVPHRKFAPKTCWGSLLADDWAFLLANPSQKDGEELKKQQEIERLTKIIDVLKQLLLALKILFDLQARQKTPPQ